MPLTIVPAGASAGSATSSAPPATAAAADPSSVAPSPCPLGSHAGFENSSRTYPPSARDPRRRSRPPSRVTEAIAGSPWALSVPIRLPVTASAHASRRSLGGRRRVARPVHREDGRRALDDRLARLGERHDRRRLGHRRAGGELGGLVRVRRRRGHRSAERRVARDHVVERGGPGRAGRHDEREPSERLRSFAIAAGVAGRVAEERELIRASGAVDRQASDDAQPAGDPSHRGQDGEVLQSGAPAVRVARVVGRHTVVAEVDPEPAVGGRRRVPDRRVRRAHQRDAVGAVGAHVGAVHPPAGRVRGAVEADPRAASASFTPATPFPDTTFSTTCAPGASRSTPPAAFPAGPRPVASSPIRLNETRCSRRPRCPGSGRRSPSR